MVLFSVSCPTPQVYCNKLVDIITYSIVSCILRGTGLYMVRKVYARFTDTRTYIQPDIVSTTKRVHLQQSMPFHLSVPLLRYAGLYYVRVLELYTKPDTAR